MTEKQLSRRKFLKYSAPVLLAATPALLPKWVLGAPSERGFVSLFDGKSLTGWHTNPQKISHGTGGYWQAIDGVLTGEQDPPGSGNGGVLMTNKSYGDFELRLELAPDYGVDSGVFLRTNERGECFQIYVDHKNGGQIGFISTERVGRPRMIIRPFSIEGVKDEQGKLVRFDTKPDQRETAWQPGYLTYHCTPEQWKKAWKVGGWNTLRIRCKGKYPKITTWINSTKIITFNSNTTTNQVNSKEELFNALGRSGAIGLQVHGGKGWPNGAKCRWQNIRIKEL